MAPGVKTKPGYVTIRVDDGPDWSRADIMGLIQTLLLVLIPLVAFLYHQIVRRLEMRLVCLTPRS